jgi:hypothetical protein
MQILKSATKLVLLLFAVSLTIAFLFDILTSKVILETKDFLVPAMAVLGYYFAYKGDNSQPYAGK